MPSNTAKTKKSSLLDIIISPASIIILVIILTGVAVWTYFTSVNPNAWYKIRTGQISKLAPKPTPTPRPIPHGKIGFTVSGDSATKPNFGRGFLDPYDPAQGTTQIITIDVTSATPVSNVEGIMKTDKKTTTIPFTFKAGTKTRGTWEGTWTVNDTYFYTYNLTFVGTNDIGTTEILYTMR